VKRLALAVLALLITALCCACLAPTGGKADYNPPPGEYRPPSNPPPSAPPSIAPPSSVPTESAPTESAPTERAKTEQEALAFGKSYTWGDGVSVTVGKPKKFKPSKFAVVEKEKRYLKFTVTVVNKSDKPLDLGLTYVSVESSNEEAHHLFDSLSGLKGPPDTKVLKGRKTKFDVGFGIADPKNVVMEVALHDNSERPSLMYST
jgi:hypothetical protein